MSDEQTRIILESLASIKKTNEERWISYEEKSDKWRDKFDDRLANVEKIVTAGRALYWLLGGVVSLFLAWKAAGK